MPAKSKKQQKFMAAVANNPKFAKKVGVPQDVGEEFMKMKKYQGGGEAMAGDRRVRRELNDLAMMQEARARSPRSRMPVRMPGGPSRGPGMKSGGKVRGCGKATKGVRSAKMVSMKGS